jgi:hypothetical protein
VVVLEDPHHRAEDKAEEGGKDGSDQADELQK